MATSQDDLTRFALKLKPKIVAYLRSKHRAVTEEDAEDMAIMAITGFATKFDAALGFKRTTYLYTCVNNEFRSWRRNNLPSDTESRKRSKQNKKNTDSIDHIQAVAGQEFVIPFTENGYQAVELLGVFKAAMQELTCSERELVKCMLRGDTDEEASAATRLSVAYIRKLKVEVRVKMSKLLGLDLRGTKYSKSVSYRRSA